MTVIVVGNHHMLGKGDKIFDDVELAKEYEGGLIHYGFENVEIKPFHKPLLVLRKIYLKVKKTRVGKELAMNATLTPRQAALGKIIVTKYHRQLGDTLMEAIKGE